MENTFSLSTEMNIMKNMKENKSVHNTEPHTILKKTLDELKRVIRADKKEATNSAEMESNWQKKSQDETKRY